ncbi:hypothetical protein K0651_01985 [Ornithinimicrobium sp. Arc0846-15]|nr:hypothetical protein [Ornithinimicrobium laminariae]
MSVTDMGKYRQAAQPSPADKVCELCGAAEVESVKDQQGDRVLGDSCLACGLVVSRGLQDPQVDADGRPRETLAARALRHRHLMVVR